MHKQDYQSILVLGPQCVKLVESIHGKNSAEYIETKKQFISSCMMVNNYNLAYKECLEAYDIAKGLYGSEKNVDCVVLISFMAAIKTKFHQFDEAKNLFSKCKELEMQLSSKFSQRYKTIQNIENDLFKTETAVNKYKKRKTKDSSFLTKIAPNTPSKFALYMTVIAAVTIGVVYYVKNKKS